MNYRIQDRMVFSTLGAVASVALACAAAPAVPPGSPTLLSTEVGRRADDRSAEKKATGKQEVVRMDEAKEVRARALLRTLIDNDVRAFEALLEQGADPNLPVDLPSVDWRKQLGLFRPVPVIVIAAMHADQRYLRGCLSHGGDPSAATDEKNGSAVVRSMWANRFDNTIALIKAGADLNRPVYDGYTLLDEAILVNRFKIASIMVEAGASPRLAKNGGEAMRRNLCLKVNYTEQARAERSRLVALLESRGFPVMCDP